MQGLSRPQQNLLRGMVRSIAEQMASVGCQWDDESWKRFLVNEFAKEVRQWPHSEVFGNEAGCWWLAGKIESGKLTREQAGLFIAWLDCWSAEREINLNMERA